MPLKRAPSASCSRCVLAADNVKNEQRHQRHFPFDLFNRNEMLKSTKRCHEKASGMLAQRQNALPVVGHAVYFDCRGVCTGKRERLCTMRPRLPKTPIMLCCCMHVVPVRRERRSRRESVSCGALARRNDTTSVLLKCLFVNTEKFNHSAPRKVIRS
jgi:hypothetical protein